MDTDLRRTLVAVADALAGATRPWWVIAGAACALHGLEDAARDVDVLMDEEDARRLWPALALPLAPGTPHPRFRSALFARWNAAPLPVELMAGFAIRRDGRRHPVAPQTREAFAVDGATVHAPARDELAALLLLAGRPSDLARARRLRDVTA